MGFKKKKKACSVFWKFLHFELWTYLGKRRSWEIRKELLILKIPCLIPGDKCRAERGWESPLTSPLVCSQDFRKGMNLYLTKFQQRNAATGKTGSLGRAQKSFLHSELLVFPPEITEMPGNNWNSRKFLAPCQFHALCTARIQHPWGFSVLGVCGWGDLEGLSYHL